MMVLRACARCYDRTPAKGLAGEKVIHGQGTNLECITMIWQMGEMMGFRFLGTIYLQAESS